MHRLMIPVLALCTLLALPGLAFADGNACAKQRLADLDGLSVDEVRLTDAEVDPLYVPLDRLQAGDTVDVEIHVDGVRHLGETLELTAAFEAAERAVDGAPEGTPVVELLAAHPQRLAQLDRMSTSHAIEITLRHDGAETTRAFADLRAGAALVAAPQPFDLRSSLELAGKTLPTKNACIDQCNWEYDDCVYSRCEPQGSQSCYAACERLFEDCLEYECSICPVETSTSTSDSLHQVNPTGIQECRWSYIYGKGYYDYLQLVIKRTTTTTTTNADCSETVTTQVSYYNSYCWSLVYTYPFCNAFFQAVPLC